MPVVLGGRGCIEPRALYRECIDHGLSTAWASLPNAYTCPLGVRPGDGWVLMKLGDLKWISPLLTFADVVGLRFESLVDREGARSVSMSSMLVVGADCLTPGFRGDEAAYLVRLADKRLLLGRSFVDRGYNVRHSFTGAYIPTTIESPSAGPWTWQTATANVWGLAPLLGTYPGLPFDPEDHEDEDDFPPDQFPEDLELYQTSVADALDTVLGRLACALRYDPIRDAFSIVRLDTPDPVADAALTQWDSRRHWDYYPIRGVLANVPGKVRVLFRKLPHVRGEDTSPFVAIDLPDDGSIPGYAANDYLAIVHDDLTANYDPIVNGTVLNNGPELATRAAARAADYFRSLDAATSRRRLIYPFALDDAGLMPGSQISSITWRETAAGTTPDTGMLTEIMHAATVPKHVWPDLTIDPLTEVIRPNGTASGECGLIDAYIDVWDAATCAWVQRVRVWAVEATTS